MVYFYILNQFYSCCLLDDALKIKSQDYKMNKYSSVKIVILLIVVFAVIDYLMLNFILQTPWANAIENIQHSPLTPKAHYGLIVYILLAIGSYYFVYRNSLPPLPKMQLLFNGFFFGFIIYAVFDFTNLTIFTNYPLNLALIDSVWGGILTSVSLLTVYSIDRYFSL